MLKGKNVKVMLVTSSGGEQVLAKAKSAEVTLGIEMESVEYLGFSTPETEEDFSGADLNVDFDQNKASYIELMEKLVSRAKDNNATSETISVEMELAFADGVKRVKFPNCKASSPSLSASGQKQRVGGRLQLHSDDIKFQ